MDTLASVARATTPADPNSIRRQQQALALSPATMSQPQRQKGADVAFVDVDLSPTPVPHEINGSISVWKLPTNQLWIFRRCLLTILGLVQILIMRGFVDLGFLISGGFTIFLILEMV